MTSVFDIALIRVPSFSLLNPTKADTFHYYADYASNNRPKFDWCLLYSDATISLSPCSGGAYFQVSPLRIEPLSNKAKEAFAVLNAAIAIMRLNNDTESAKRLCQKHLKEHIAAAKDLYLPED